MKGNTMTRTENPKSHLATWKEYWHRICQESAKTQKEWKPEHPCASSARDLSRSLRSGITIICVLGIFLSTTYLASLLTPEFSAENLVRNGFPPLPKLLSINPGNLSELGFFDGFAEIMRSINWYFIGSFAIIFILPFKMFRILRDFGPFQKIWKWTSFENRFASAVKQSKKNAKSSYETYYRVGNEGHQEKPNGESS